MPDFTSGVSDFVLGTCTVTNFFPIDMRGNADVSCKQCRFYRSSYRKCALNDELIAYPEKYIGQNCPLDIKERE